MKCTFCFSLLIKLVFLKTCHAKMAKVLLFHFLVLRLTKFRVHKLMKCTLLFSILIKLVFWKACYSQIPSFIFSFYNFNKFQSVSTGEMHSLFDYLNKILFLNACYAKIAKVLLFFVLWKSRQTPLNWRKLLLTYRYK